MLQVRAALPKFSCVLFAGLEAEELLCFRRSAPETGNAMGPLGSITPKTSLERILVVYEKRFCCVGCSAAGVIAQLWLSLATQRFKPDEAQAFSRANQCRAQNSCP